VAEAFKLADRIFGGLLGREQRWAIGAWQSTGLRPDSRATRRKSSFRLTASPSRPGTSRRTPERARSSSPGRVAWPCPWSPWMTRWSWASTGDASSGCWRS